MCPQAPALVYSAGEVEALITAAKAGKLDHYAQDFYGHAPQGHRGPQREASTSAGISRHRPEKWQFPGFYTPKPITAIRSQLRITERPL